jgi:hypothetical protein
VTVRETDPWKENAMMRRATLLVTVALGLTMAACGGPEKIVVDKYFGAVNQEDSQTLSAFATVAFEKKVDDWKIVQTLSSTEEPAPLPELVKLAKDADAEVSKNQREINFYTNQHPGDVTEVLDLIGKRKPIPARLQGVADTLERYNAKKKELRQAFARAKERVDKEKQTVILSVGEVDNLETLTGTMATRQIELLLTIGGEKIPHLMTLRQYKLQAAPGIRSMNRWVVCALEPKK